MRTIFLALIILMLAPAFGGPAGAADGDLRRGIQLIAEKRFSEALTVLNAAVDSAPDRPDAYRHRGFARQQIGDHSGAAADFSRVLEMVPNEVATLYHRANAWFLLNDRRRCLADCDRLVKLTPQDMRAYMLRGTIRQNFGRWGPALADFEQALTLAPEDPMTLNQTAWLLATCPDDAFRDGPRALKLARQAAGIRRQAQIIDSLAAAYAELGQFEMAELMQQSAIALGRQNGTQSELIMYQQRLAFYQGHRPWRDLSVPDRHPDAANAGPSALLPYTIQVSSLKNRIGALETVREMQGRGEPAFCSPARIKGRGIWYRIYFGRYATRVQAKKTAKELQQRQFRYTQVAHRPYALVLAGGQQSEAVAPVLDRHGLCADPNGRLGAFENAAEARTLAATLRNAGIEVQVMGE